VFHLCHVAALDVSPAGLGPTSNFCYHHKLLKSFIRNLKIQGARMSELRSHKRTRSVDQCVICHSEQRFITAGGDVEPEETRSESENDSDVIVVGKGRKCPRVSSTPLILRPSSMRTCYTRINCIRKYYTH
jgi:hypothetical protein